MMSMFFVLQISHKILGHYPARVSRVARVFYESKSSLVSKRLWESINAHFSLKITIGYVQKGHLLIYLCSQIAVGRVCQGSSGERGKGLPGFDF